MMDVTEPYGWCKKHMRVVQYNDKCDDFEPALKRVCGNCEHFYHEDSVCPYKPHEVYPDDEACERFKPAKELCICINCAHSEWPCGSQPDGGGIVLREVLTGVGELERAIEVLRARLAEEMNELGSAISRLEGIEIKGEICADTVHKKGKTYTYYRLKLYEDPRYHKWGKYLGKEIPAWARAGVEVHKLLREIRPIWNRLKNTVDELDVLLKIILADLAVLRNHLSKADMVLRSLDEDLQQASENGVDSGRET